MIDIAKSYKSYETNDAMPVENKGICCALNRCLGYFKMLKHRCTCSIEKLVNFVPPNLVYT